MADVIDPSRTTYRFVHNPHSGNANRNAAIRREVDNFIQHSGLRADLVETSHPTHATQLARQAVAEGCNVIVAMGGDGTMNEVARAVVHTDATFGLIPGGSGNGLGRHLGLQGSISQALDTLIKGRVRPIDTGEINHHPFINVMGVGYDAELSGRLNHLTHRGLWPYLREGVNLWRKYQPTKFRIRHAGETRELFALMVAVANSDQYGYDCFISPGAQVDDGLLNLVIVKPINALQFAPLAYRMRRGTADQSPHVQLLSGDRFVIESDSETALHTDGEVIGKATQIEVAVRPQSLRMLVPA